MKNMVFKIIKHYFLPENTVLYRFFKLQIKFLCPNKSHIGSWVSLMPLDFIKTSRQIGIPGKGREILMDTIKTQGLKRTFKGTLPAFSITAIDFFIWAKAFSELEKYTNRLANNLLIAPETSSQKIIFSTFLGANCNIGARFASSFGTNILRQFKTITQTKGFNSLQTLEAIFSKGTYNAFCRGLKPTFIGNSLQAIIVGGIWKGGLQIFEEFQNTSSDLKN